MRSESFKEIIVGSSLIFFLVFLVNPFSMYMPSKTVMVLLGGVAILTLLFMSFLWKESVHDERESFHRLLAGRTAFLAGAGMLLFGITVQTFQHRLDPWLVIALGTMVITKLLTRWYSRENY